MSGPRESYRYLFLASDGTTSRTAFVECDADVTSLVLGGLQNTQPPAPSAANLFRMRFSAAYSPKGKVARARLALIEFTAGLPPGRVTRRTWVPVLTISRYNSYVVGQSGSWLGLPVKLVQKVDGSPDIRGKR